MARRSKAVLVILIAAAGVLLVAAIFAKRRLDHRSENVPSSEDAGRSRAQKRPKVTSEERSDGGRTLRIQRPDGSIDVIEESEERVRARVRLEDEAAETYRRTRHEFHSAFLEKWKKEGPAAAVQFLEAYLRNSSGSIDDAARVFKACELTVQLLREIANGDPDPAVFAQFAPALSTRIRSMLQDPSIEDEPKVFILAQFGGLHRSVGFAVDELILVDGEWKYDPQGTKARVYAYVNADTQRQFLLNAAKEENPLLRDASMAELLASLVTSSAGLDVRYTALLALAGRPDVLDRLDLQGLAAHDPDEDMRRSAIELMGLRPERVDAATVFRLLHAQTESDMKAHVLKTLGSVAMDDPQLRAMLGQVFSSPYAAIDPWKDSLLRRAAVELVLDGYAGKRDKELLSLLTSHLDSWARDAKYGSASIVTVAEGAASRGLKDLVPYLTSILPSLTSESDRRRIQDAVQKLTGS